MQNYSKIFNHDGYWLKIHRYWMPIHCDTIEDEQNKNKQKKKRKKLKSLITKRKVYIQAYLLVW